MTMTTALYELLASFPALHMLLDSILFSIWDNPMVTQIVDSTSPEQVSHYRIYNFEAPDTGIASKIQSALPF